MRESPQELVVYCALDKEFSEPVLQQFEQESGITVLANFDQESNKTVGQANQIIQQKDQQRCDVFWNNEILHTLRLKRLGLLESCPVPVQSEYPDPFVSDDFDWTGFAARARVFLVNTEKLPDKDSWPTSIRDLADPKWKNECAMARPFFGTTASHAAVLYSSLGLEGADRFFREVAKNAIIEGGNKQVAVNVSRGRYAFGITDTDDAIIEIEQGNPVAIVFPDQGADDTGTLLIPNTVCIIKGGPNPDNARKFLEFVLQKTVEEQLAAGRSAQIPLNLESRVRSQIEPENLKIMPVDFEQAAKAWEQAQERLLKIFPL